MLRDYISRKVIEVNSSGRLLAAFHRDERQVDLAGRDFHLHFFRRQMAEVIGAYPLKRDDCLAAVLCQEQKFSIHWHVSVPPRWAAEGG